MNSVEQTMDTRQTAENNAPPVYDGVTDPLASRTDQTVPDQTVPDQTVPDQTVPDQTVPDHAQSFGCARPAVCEWWMTPPKVVQRRCIWVDGHSVVLAAVCRSVRVVWGALSRGVRAIERGICAVGLALIWFYQRVLSPCLPARCRFVPSCSAYAAESLRHHGLFRGLGKSLWRVLRCHPFSAGGYDPPS